MNNPLSVSKSLQSNYHLIKQSFDPTRKKTTYGIT